METVQTYLNETFFLNFHSPAMHQFVAGIDATQGKKEIAVDLYYLVRDSFVYNPYHLDLRNEALKASAVLTKKSAWCVEKSTLLAALARRFEIPTRLGYAIVRNHIGMEKMMRFLKKDEIVFHGYVELFIDHKWVQCTPAFDKRLCALTGVPPLEWNGEENALLQAFQGEKKYMEYIHYYGVFEDVPAALMNAEMKKHYPHLFEKEYNSKEFSFLHA